MYAIVLIESPVTIRFSSFFKAAVMAANLTEPGTDTGYVISLLTGEVILSF